jgi:hypothetical protein
MPSTLDYASPTDGPRRLPARLSWPLFLACLYLPYGWILFIDYPWNGYRLLWLKLWVALPGLIPCGLVRVFSTGGEAVGIPVMGMSTAVLVAALLFPFRRPRPRSAVLLTSVVVLILSCLNSWLARVIFQD